jgi:NTE family protein
VSERSGLHDEVRPAPRVALVLGAGGIAGGAFHAGVLAALHDSLGWDARSADLVVGTSAGSLAGATLRAGVSPADLYARAEGRPVSGHAARVFARVGPPLGTRLRREERIKMPAAADVAATLARAVVRPLAARPWAVLAALVPDGTVPTDMITDGVAALHPEGTADDRLWICAVRRRDGRLVVFGRDNRPPLADAVAASCAIPGLFRPVAVDGEDYVDGGAHSPTNADVILPRDPRPDLVVVSSPMSFAGSARRTGLTPFRRWSRALLDTEAARLRRRGIPVVAFQPTDEVLAATGTNAMDPDRRPDIARATYESTRARLTQADIAERVQPLVNVARGGRY